MGWRRAFGGAKGSVPHGVTALWHHVGTMRVDDLLEARRPNFSFEFFPPQDDDGVTALFTTIAALRHASEAQPRAMIWAESCSSSGVAAL